MPDFIPEIIPETISDTFSGPILELPHQVISIAALILLVSLLLLILTFSRLRQKRFIPAAVYSALSPALMLISIVLIAGALNLYTYQRISHEQDVAEIFFKQISPRYYSATLYYGEQQSDYLLMGDEWQLDARIIKWKTPVNLAGLDSLYRLERISGRYRDVEAEKVENRTVYALTENYGLDIWTITKKYPSWIPWVDAYYGTATYLPMADKARFKITLSQTGLLARAMNEPGEHVIHFWD